MIQKESGNKYPSITLNAVNGMIKAKALLINRKEILEVFCNPRTFIRVFVPVFE